MPALNFLSWNDGFDWGDYRVNQCPCFCAWGSSKVYQGNFGSSIHSTRPLPTPFKKGKHLCKVVPQRSTYLTKRKSEDKNGDMAGEGGETTLVSAKSESMIWNCFPGSFRKNQNEGFPSHVIWIQMTGMSLSSIGNSDRSRQGCRQKLLFSEEEQCQTIKTHLTQGLTS